MVFRIFSSVGKKTALLVFIALAYVSAKKPNVLFERWRY
jgi:hypothetical protein